MKNELLLILSVIFTYGSVLVAFKFFGRIGLICLNALVTIAANIEVMMLIEAFGIHQTLGNILFASTFLITDILSENYGKESANEAVKIGVFSSLFFIIVSRTWLLYSPSLNDTVFTHVNEVFRNTPRIMISGVLVYAITQRLDVEIYHKVWNITYVRCGKREKYLWLRNNSSTLLSQFINTVLFTLIAFLGVYDLHTIYQMMFSSYIIFIFTSLADTPILYLSRNLKSRSISNRI